MNYTPVIIVKALTPLMLLSLALAITSLITALTFKSRKWIPITCGIGFLALSLFQLYLRTAQFYSVMGTYGMGKPEAVAEALWRFLAVVIITPLIAPLALCGTAIAALKRILVRVVFIVVVWAALITANTFATRHLDWKLSVSMADGRGDREDRLWIIQRDAYIDTLKQGGLIVDPNEIDWNDLLPPREVCEDIRRDDFFEEFPPPSILKALFTETLDESSAINSEMLDREIMDKHRAACAAEGVRLAQEKLESERKE